MDLRQIDALVASAIPELGPVNVFKGVRAVAEWQVERYRMDSSSSEFVGWVPATPEARGAKLVWVWKYDGKDVVVREVERFSSDMNAAMQVWHALRAQGVYLDVQTYADFYAVVARHESGVKLAYDEATSLPQAICGVALLVNGVEVPKS